MLDYRPRCYSKVAERTKVAVFKRLGVVNSQLTIISI